MLILEGDKTKSAVTDILNSNSKCICCSYYGEKNASDMWIDNNDGDAKSFKELLADLEDELENEAEHYDFLIVYTDMKRSDEDFNSLLGYLEMYNYPVNQTIVACKG